MKVHKRNYELWTTIYPEFKSYVHLLQRDHERPILCMPYLAPVPKDDRDKLCSDAESGLRKSLWHIAMAPKVPNNLLWRHIGKWNDGSYYFFDFGIDGMKASPKDYKEKEKWVIDSLQELKW